MQVHGFGLTHWLPLHATSPFNSGPGDTYRFRSIIAPGVVFGLDEGGNVRYDERTYPWDWHRKMLADVRRARPFWYGDFYPLTSCRRGRRRLDRPPTSPSGPKRRADPRVPASGQSHD